MNQEIRFTDENLRKLEELKKRYPTTKALTLPVLWMAQEQFGFISQEVMTYVAVLLDVPFRHVLGVVTFYTMFKTKAAGKHHLEVCTNVSCMIRGSDRLLKHLEARLGIRPGETTTDGKFSLSEVECMGSCGTAPMMAVGNDYHENLTEKELDDILATLT